MYKAAFFSANPHFIEKYYFDDRVLDKIKKYAIFEKKASRLDELSEAEVLFTTWGMANLKKEEIEKYMPNIKAVFYGAGSVRGFARPFLEKGVLISSSWGANAVPVAEYTLAAILFANKGFWQKSQAYTSGKATVTFPGNMDVKVGILGAGMIGRKVIELLKPFDIDVLVYDPYFTVEEAERLGVVKVDSLPEVFENCQTISNHIANLPQTVGILNKDCFSKMKDGATFINTGRQAQIVDKDLIEVLKENPSIVAVMDVLDTPFEKQKENEYFSLPNVIATPHIAGSSENEILRMKLLQADEFERFAQGEALKCRVNLKMLENMA